MTDHTNADEWARAQDAVRDAADELRGATDHTTLRQWAKDHGLADSAGQWVKVKAELRKQLGIDYDELRTRTYEAAADELLKVAETAPRITLCVAGDVETNSFAVCPPDNPDEAWYGTFHPKDRPPVTDDATAETNAARKALFLASQTRTELALEAINLTIHTTYPDLDTEALTASASTSRVALTVEVVDTCVAVEMCRAPGWRGWREIRLPALVHADTEPAS